jgi:type IV pilus assembly protein PilE
VNTFNIKATGNGAVTGFVFEVNQLNQRRTTGVKSGWGAAPVNCWVVRKGGGCT